MKHFAPLVAPGPSIFAKLSARVGSITDNRLGGWYGYRASKAALNMLLQTAAIELQRRHRNLRVVALQPGTVDSALSKPYQGAAPQVLTADESVAGMLKALQSLPTLPGAQFIDYRGNPIPW
jgi:NAD(P)-dependent dehydrogenase (short-subunit alcohol dehydrogenase family)